VIGNGNSLHSSPRARGWRPRVPTRVPSPPRPGQWGFEVQALDLAERPMKQALRQFKTLVQAGDEVVFFFAGHGVQIGGVNYLLPTDIQGESEDQVRDEGMQVQRVLATHAGRARASCWWPVTDAWPRQTPCRGTGRAIGGTRAGAHRRRRRREMIIFSGRCDTTRYAT
jgi:hypothetical protein